MDHSAPTPPSLEVDTNLNENDETIIGPATFPPADNDDGLLDITHHILQCSSSLNHQNPLLSIPSFNLMDSMSALVLMDPSMDSCQQSNMRKAPISLQEMKHWNTVSYENIKDYSYEIVIRLNAFLSGCGVAESTYTCLYAHDSVLSDMRDTKNLTEAQSMLYTTTLLFCKLSLTIRQIVAHADIYEEEDFVMNAYNFRFFANYVPEDELSETVNDTLKLMLQKEDLKCVWLCLGYLWNFYKCCNSLTKMTPKQNLAQQLSKIKRMIQSSLSQLSQLEKLYSPTNTSEFLDEAFDININRNLFGNAPVRKIHFASYQESIQHLYAIMKEFDLNICDFLLDSTSFVKCRNIVRSLNSWDCNILTRSIIVLNLYFDDLFLGQFSVNDFIGQALMDEAGLSRQIVQESETSLNRLGKPIYDWLKVFLLNKNRQREYIETFMFREWANLQKDVIDPLSNFIIYTTMDIMDHFHMLSLEIRLVHGHYDYCIAYWYRTFIVSAMINVGVGMSNARREVRFLEQKRKNMKKKTKEEDDAQLLILGLRRSLCRGMAQYITALYQLNYLTKPPNYEFTTHEQRFQKRFQSFSLFLQPPHLQYDDYLQGTDYTNVTPTELLSSATDCFKSGKLLADKLLQFMDTSNDFFLPVSKKEITSLRKVCIGNLLYLHILNQQVDGKREKKDVRFDFDTNGQFCIIQIV